MRLCHHLRHILPVLNRVIPHTTHLPHKANLPDSPLRDRMHTPLRLNSIIHKTVSSRLELDVNLQY